ncbi:hypothetical protein PIB30_057046 [Stylosanthes scabra]|uniref:Uncharacterized protein n=1 Tax=Stylosanthes scabra TaxID=79078 RepID=A0ABU6WJ61_9FABA|nr:hypothetical protein [Stylosanthes scabra]
MQKEYCKCAKQHYTHVGGSKTLARREEEEEQRHGRELSRGELWTMVHKRSDGSYIHDDARVVGEHSGRVRGVGSGPCLTQLFGQTSQSSSHGVQIHEYQKEIVKLKAEAAEEKKKMQTMENLLRFLIQRKGDDLPPEIASQMNALGNGPTTSHTSPSSEIPEPLSPP